MQGNIKWTKTSEHLRKHDQIDQIRREHKKAQKSHELVSKHEEKDSRRNIRIHIEQENTREENPGRCNKTQGDKRVFQKMYDGSRKTLKNNTKKLTQKNCRQCKNNTEKTARTRKRKKTREIMRKCKKTVNECKLPKCKKWEANVRNDTNCAGASKAHTHGNTRKT